MNADPTMTGASSFARRADETYWTEPRVTHALCDAIELPPVVWEPACGRGDISRVLEERGHSVRSTDLRGYGYVVGGTDFLEFDGEALAPAIITNPPFGKDGKMAEAFLRKALALTEPCRGMVTMLLRNEFDSACTRRDIFEHPAFVQKLVLTFRPRWDWWEVEKSKHGPRHNYSWFHFGWSRQGPPTIAYLRKEAS